MKQKILLMMDANENITMDSKGIVTIIHECSLFNLMGDLHPTNSTLVIYDSGNRTINQIFDSSHVGNSMTRGDALPFYHLIQADHRTLYIDFDARHFLVDHKKMALHQDTDP